MKILDVGFLKTKPNRLKNSKTGNSVSAVWFSKTDFGSLGMVFTLSHSQFILQHDRINSHSIFCMPYLCTSSSDSLHFYKASA